MILRSNYIITGDGARQAVEIVGGVNALARTLIPYLNL